MSDLEDLSVMDQNHSCVQKLDLCVLNRALCPTRSGSICFSSGWIFSLTFNCTKPNQLLSPWFRQNLMLLLVLHASSLPSTILLLHLPRLFNLCLSCRNSPRFPSPVGKGYFFSWLLRQLK